VKLDYAEYHKFSLGHRSEHGCGGYPYENGQELTDIANEAQAKSILELGTAVGYSAYCFAQSTYDPHIDTIDNDEEHVEIARQQLEACGVGEKVTAIHGDFASVIATFDKKYDLIFFDGFEPDASLLATLDKLAQDNGVIVTANLSWSSTAKEYLGTLKNMGWEHEIRRDIAISRRS